jgi:ribosome-binding factor A
MDFTRREQLEKHLEKMIGGIVPRFFPAQKFGFVSVISVQIARGLDSAKVGCAVERNKHQFDEFARKVIGAIQKEVNQNLPRKKIPKIILELDRTNDLLAKIEALKT